MLPTKARTPIRRRQAATGSPLLAFVEEHKGALSAIGIFGGFSGIVANAAISQYVVVTFGFLVVLFVHELRTTIPAAESDSIWMFRAGLSYALLVLFLGWTLEVAPMRPSISLLPVVAFFTWLLQWASSRTWSRTPRLIAVVFAVGLLFLVLLGYLAAAAGDLLRTIGLA